MHAFIVAKMLKSLVDLRVSNGKDLNEEERNLLSVGFKNIVGTKRASWYIIIISLRFRDIYYFNIK